MEAGTGGGRSEESGLGMKSVKRPKPGGRGDISSGDRRYGGCPGARRAGAVDGAGSASQRAGVSGGGGPR